MTLPPPLGPEDQALFNLRALLIKGSLDTAFKARLLADVVKTAQEENLDIGTEGKKHFDRVKADLIRFANQSGLVQQDALHWANGVLVENVTCPLVIDARQPDRQGERWQLTPLSIARFAFVCAPPTDEGSKS